MIICIDDREYNRSDTSVNLSDHTRIAITNQRQVGELSSLKLSFPCKNTSLKCADVHYVVRAIKEDENYATSNRIPEILKTGNNL